jgi:hypothetical protein
MLTRKRTVACLSCTPPFYELFRECLTKCLSPFQWQGRPVMSRAQGDAEKSIPHYIAAILTLGQLNFIPRLDINFCNSLQKSPLQRDADSAGIAQSTRFLAEAD